MARRQVIARKKVAKPRVTRTEAYLINKKYLGEEPEFNAPLSESEYAKALTWYNYMCTNEEAREYLVTYLNANNRKQQAKLINRVSNDWTSTTAGWIARMLTRGYELPKSSSAFFEQKIQEMIARVQPDESEKPTNVVSIQERMREKALDVVGDIEELLDSGNEFSLYDWMKARQLPAAYCNFIVNHYAPIVDELIQAYEGKDPQLKEAYSHLSKKDLKARIILFNQIVEDCERYSNVTKKVRKPRKPRTISNEKKLKHFKFQKEDGQYKIASVNPEKILGANELWTFNTKTKVVTVFRAMGPAGLQVNRTAIAGYDDQASFSRGTGRKTEDVLDKIQKGGKIVLRRLTDELKTTKPLQTRINEATILLKVS